MPKALPGHPNIDWLKKTARQRLNELRAGNPEAKLYQAQLDVANAYGFASWRALKAHVDGSDAGHKEEKRVFQAARSGDVETVRRALAAGFDPSAVDADGGSIHQIAKDEQFEELELLVRDVQERESRPAEIVQAIDGIQNAAREGDLDALRQRLDAHPALIDALGNGFHKYTALHRAAARNQHACLRLLIERGADPHRRDFPDNATALHVAAVKGDLTTVRLLVEAGADPIGDGDDYAVGVLGWATCFARVRQDVATYLLDHGARLNVWTAIALDRGDELAALIARDRSLLAARMSRNQHRRTPLHHAAAKNRPDMVRLLIALGADPNAPDATGATPLTTAAQENGDPGIVSDLLAAGARPDFLTALGLKQHDRAEALLREDPARIGPQGRDTIALHLAVSKKNLAAIEWLIAHGVDVNAKRSMWDCNHTALHMSIENGAIDIARMLLDAGADPDVRDDKYRATALGWAHFFGREDFAELIRQRGGQT